MPDRADRFRPKCLRVAEWPIAHQAAWERAVAKGGLFDEVGGAARWRPRSIEKTRKGYGVWLCWNVYRQVPIDHTRPENLVTQEAVRSYVGDLRAINSSMTAFCRLQELYDAVRVMAPSGVSGSAWDWLATAVKNLRAQARPSKNKRARLQRADALERLGYALMAEAEAPTRERSRGLTELQRALAFRDGLMIALLIHRPLRLSNFHALRIGKSLIIQETSASIAFGADETKSRRPIEASVPANLFDALMRYVGYYRLLLLTASKKAKGVATDALWISRDGTELSDIALHNAIRRRTKDAFGAALPPHWFRDASVTTLVNAAPASSRLTAGILGHSTPEITEKHYNQALMIDSARKYAGWIETMLERAPQRKNHAPSDQGNSPAASLGCSPLNGRRRL